MASTLFDNETSTDKGVNVDRRPAIAESPHSSDEHLSMLVSPGGGERLKHEGNFLVGPDRHRYPIENGIVRMLDQVDRGLAAELDAQQAALEIYLDERLLLTRYEHRVAQLAVERLLEDLSGEILDAGCGIGLLGRLYPEAGLYGIDASFPLLKQATSGYRLRVECSAERLPFPDESFDAVLGLNMLHHVVDPVRAMAEFARVLKPGGILVTVDPRRVGPIELIKRLLRKGDPAFAQSHKAFDAAEYTSLLRAGGAFEIEQFQHVGLLALLAAGGLDQIRVSRRVPAGPLLDGFAAIDCLLGGLPMFRRAGLNLAVRARRGGGQ